MHNIEMYFAALIGVATGAVGTYAFLPRGKQGPMGPPGPPGPGIQPGFVERLVQRELSRNAEAVQKGLCTDYWCNRDVPHGKH